MHNTPPGSYFRGLLRFHGLEDGSGRDALAEAMQHSGDDALFVDEDPQAFEALLNYIRYNSSCSSSSSSSSAAAAQQLLPQTEPQRSMVRAAAHRLGLDAVAAALTPPRDLLEHLHLADVGLREHEEACRASFVSSPAAMVEAWRQGQLLLDVFTPATLASFAYEAYDAKPPYPELFTHCSHPTHAHPAGSSSVVGSMDKFAASFEALTGGLFQGVDWSNMVVAGGAVMACLMRPPDAVEAASHTAAAGQQLWQSWLGPNELCNKTQPHQKLHVSGMFYGPNETAAASTKLQQLLQQLHANRYKQNDASLVVRGEHAVTIVTETCHTNPVHVQVVLRIYSCPAEVLMGFDIDSCCGAYDGSRVYVTPRARRALNRRQNLADPGRLSPSYESRLAKYARRGFRVAVPGFPGRCSIDSSIYLQPFKELQGLARLLRLEASSKAKGFRPGLSVL
ncbi:hypothetical protein OEZ85_004256 [Tetradesmus obliquus]|uniref:Potassium channel tetramerisation-type BTB domain-containing protein n=1 Tax=Tetradesmus obliquus TaxID=3088 RepID=A0ABY8UK71_TETOB|nr:hypothetical protein OEZ85_004256 [Tetradesmus obliquus]